MEGPILLVPFPKRGLRPELAEGPSLSLCESGNIQDCGLCFTGSPARGQSSWSGACCPLEARWMAASWGQTKGPGRLLASLTAEVAWGQPRLGQSLAPADPSRRRSLVGARVWAQSSRAVRRDRLASSQNLCARHRGASRPREQHLQSQRPVC